MSDTTNGLRPQFEAWILATRKQTQPFGLTERSGEGYLDLYTEKHWQGWKAALAAHPAAAEPPDEKVKNE